MCLTVVVLCLSFSPFFVSQPPVSWLDSCQSYSLTTGLCNSPVYESWPARWVEDLDTVKLFTLFFFVAPAHVFRGHSTTDTPWRRWDHRRHGHTPLSLRFASVNSPNPTLPPSTLLFNGRNVLQQIRNVSSCLQVALMAFCVGFSGATVIPDRKLFICLFVSKYKTLSMISDFFFGFVNWTLMEQQNLI